MEKLEKRLFTVKDVAAYLQVNQTTIYRLLRSSKIPAFKVGGDWRFNLERIDAWRLSADAPPSSGSPQAAWLSEPLGTSAQSGIHLGEQTSSRPPMEAAGVPALLAKLHQAIGQTVTPLAELHALLPAIRRIAAALEDKRDASEEIAGLYAGRAIPLREHCNSSLREHGNSSLREHADDLLESAPIPLGVVNRERRLVSFNDAYRRLFGFSRRHLHSIAVTDLIHKADLDRFVTLNGQLFSGRIKSVRFVGRRLTANGPPILTASEAWSVRRKSSAVPELVAAVIQRVATKREATLLFARCAEDLSRRREKLLSGG
jgi:excisionase family DNA binding protein/PAS domain S-box-containing protein